MMEVEVIKLVLAVFVSGAFQTFATVMVLRERIDNVKEGVNQNRVSLIRAHDRIDKINVRSH